MGRRKFSPDLFPCGHARERWNVEYRADDGTQRCITCRRERSKKYQREHPEYFKAYRDKLRDSGYRQAYMKAWRADSVDLPKVRDFVRKGEA